MCKGFYDFPHETILEKKQVKPGFTNYQPRGLAIWNQKIKQLKNAEIL